MSATGSPPYLQVVSDIRQRIESGQLKPGDRLPPERELAAQLGIGRSALREALRVLEAGGLLVLKKGKTGGAFISTGNASVVSDSMFDMFRLSSVSVEQAFEVRAWIQTGLVRAACQRATPEQIARLRENVLATKQLHEAGDVEQRRLVGVRFHNILAESTHNPVAVMTVRALTDTLTSLSTDLGSYPGPSFYKDRLRFVDALEKRDEAAAQEAMAHILKATQQLYLRLEKQRSAAPAPVAAPSAPRKAAASQRKKAT